MPVGGAVRSEGCIRLSLLPMALLLWFCLGSTVFAASVSSVNVPLDH